ncbi:ABC transporter substrate-binding protein [Jiangella sp. DSM 45060]|uniref:ABC transporter substrate-binding protein n=1 Tax=Jiangella sp. DSM 45060 TaxID=1798224 RepID=UPI00087977EA|nr:iron-siderophore ABC transporter substrate-binding protein [Jiangella sp. DSM 45060]SDT39833.1 iron complex transport system substrate-binding protein [Jiangella sp. DSM 45060]
MTLVPRSLRAASAVAVLALALTACGSDDEPAADASGAAGYTVEHAMGTTELPGEPSRVVVLDSPHLDAAVALGVTPVGATEAEAGAGYPDYLGDLDGVETVGLTVEPSVEAVAQLEPDLIIGARVRHEELYADLSQIAPTVFSADSGTNWKEQVEIVGAALNRQDDAQALLDEFAQRAAAIGESVGAAGRTVSMVRFLPENFRLYGPDTFSGSILTEAGFDLGDHTWNEYSMAELSPEEFEQIDGDLVIHTSYGDPRTTTRPAVERLWTGLPAIAAGDVHEVEDDTWMLGIGVLGANLILDELEGIAGTEA